MRAVLRALVLVAPFSLAALPAMAQGTQTLDNITVKAGAFTLTVPKITVEGTSATPEQLKALVSGGKGELVAKAYSGLNASAVVIPEMVVESRQDKTVVKGTLRNLRFTDVSNGKAKEASAESWSSSTTAEGLTKPIEGRLGAMAFTNLDLAAIMRFYLTTRENDNAPLVTLYESFTGKDLSSTTEDGMSSVGSVVVTEVKARPLETPFDQFYALTANPRGMKKATDEQKALLAAVVADVAGSLSVAKAELNDVALALPDTGSGAGKASIKQISVGSYGAGVLGAFGFSGFAMETKDGSFSMGTFALRRFDLNPLVTLLKDEAAKANDDDDDDDDADDDEDLPNPRQYVPTLDQFVIADLKGDFATPDKKGNAANGERAQFSLGSIDLKGSGYRLGVPTELEASIANLKLALPANSQDKSMQTLAAMGITGLDLSTHLAIGWNEAKREITLRDLSQNDATLGSVALSGLVGNAEKDLFDGTTEQATMAAMSLRLMGVEAKIVNKGLFEKFVAVTAKQQGMDEAALKSQWGAMATLMLPALLGPSPGVRTIGDAVNRFIADPKSLRIKATSKAGLGLAEMDLFNKPPELMKRLDIEAAANE